LAERSTVRFLHVDLSTNPGLLVRLSTGSRDEDWKVFYERYAKAIVSFAQKLGLEEHGASDVLQETMLVVMRRMPGFQYDPERGRFRNWLLTIVANKVREARRRLRQETHVSLDAEGEDGASLQDRLETAGEKGDARLEEAWRQSLLEQALHQLLSDPRTKPETVAVFRACALGGLPVAEAAAQFGLKENAVYQIKDRMVKRLRALLEQLEEGRPVDPADVVKV
jgi:RNA polymerase sigma-70 factor (ECF subfamily)